MIPNDLDNQVKEVLRPLVSGVVQLVLTMSTVPG
jgi:hypothetical protein